MSHIYNAVGGPNYWPHNRVVAASGITPDPIAKNLTIVGAKTVETDISVIANQANASWIFPFTTSDGVGTFAVWACDNWDADKRSGDFVDVTSMFTALTPVAGANGNCTINANGLGFQAVKVIYTQASGTVVLKSSFSAKA